MGIRLGVEGENEWGGEEVRGLLVLLQRVKAAEGIRTQGVDEGGKKGRRVLGGAQASEKNLGTPDPVVEVLLECLLDVGDDSRRLGGSGGKGERGRVEVGVQLVLQLSDHLLQLLLVLEHGVEALNQEVFLLSSGILGRGTLLGTFGASLRLYYSRE